MLGAIAHAVADRFSASADRVFIIDSAGRELTYGQLARAAAAAVRCLKAVGVSRGDRIGFLLPHGADFAIFYFSCLLGGITAVPINGALPIKDLSFILPRCRLKAVVVAGGDTALRIAVGEAGFADIAFLPRLDPIALLAGPPAAQREVDALVAEIDPFSLLSVHFTSGTTSLPKGVPHKAASLLGNAAAFNAAFGIGEDCVMLHLMPMAYMAGFLNTLLVPFMAGGRVVLAREFSAQIIPRFWKPIVENKVNMVWVSPSMLVALNKVDRDPGGPAYCRANPLMVFSATAPLPMKVRAAFEEKYGTPVFESYGLSEVLLLTANLGQSGSPPHAVGPAISGVNIEVRGADEEPLPPLVDGDIFVKTPYGALGYLDYTNGNPTPVCEEWFDTGDIGHMDRNGYLFITGRRKDLIVRGGFNVSPRTIEELLLQHPAVDGIAIVGTPHDFYGEQIVAAIQLGDGISLDAVLPELRGMCQAHLGAQMVPDRFVAVMEFPTSVTGKIQKNLLRVQLAPAAL
jgi:acyl-CoA synthetase (AMP-forming)/AMP-acid ligase II